MPNADSEHSSSKRTKTKPLTIVGRAGNIQGSAVVFTIGGDIAHIMSAGEWDFDIAGRDVIIIGHVLEDDYNEFIRKDRNEELHITLQDVKWKFRTHQESSEDWSMTEDFVEFDF